MKPDRDEPGDEHSFAPLAVFMAGCVIAVVVLTLECQQTELAILNGVLIGVGLGFGIDDWCARHNEMAGEGK